VACGNPDISRDGLASQPAEPSHPTVPVSEPAEEEGWFRDQTLWSMPRNREPGRVDVYFDPAGGMQRDEQREGGFRDTGYVGLAATILGKGAPTPHAHFGARIEGDDPATAVLVIDTIYHGRLVPGWVAQAGGGPVALGDDASAEGADLPKP
jgi:hypothetical protein